MVTPERLSQISDTIEQATKLFKVLHVEAPDIVPDSLKMLLVMPDRAHIEKELQIMFGRLEDDDEKEAFCSALEGTFQRFVKVGREFHQRIESRKQPEGVPRREGDRKIHQFKKRKGDW